MTETSGRGPLTFAALSMTAAMDAIGFGIALPLLPSYAHAFGIQAWQVGLIFSIFSIGQAVGETIWGRLSDHYGRKPILLVTLSLAVIGYGALAFAPTFLACLAARLVCGIAGGNAGLVQALMIDICEPDRLTARLSTLGASGAVGFIIGPAAGGLLVRPNQGLAGFQGVFLLAAGVSLISSLIVAFSVPRVRRRSSARPKLKAAPYRIPRAALALIGVNIGVMGAFAGIDGVFGLWTNARFDWSARELGMAFATAGCVGALAQLLVTGRAVRRFGDLPVLQFGLAVTALGLVIQAFPPNGQAMTAAIGMVSFGLSLSMPTTASLLSRQAPAGAAGRMMGANMAAASLARILGPLFAGLLYSGLAHQAPFLLGSVIVLATVGLAGMGRGPSTQPAG
jgi:MFS family permease